MNRRLPVLAVAWVVGGACPAAQETPETPETTASAPAPAPTHGAEAPPAPQDVPPREEVACPAGSTPAPQGGCMEVGIQGCAAPFVDDDGLCRPRLGDCAPGTIPRFDEGCVPVGIPDCAAQWRGEDGLCRPDPAACPPPSVPDIHDGCVTVGIPDCAPELLDGEGRCRPTLSLCPAGAIPVFDEGCVAIGVTDCAPMFVEDGVCTPRAVLCPPGHFPVPTRGCVPLDGPGGCPDGPWSGRAEDPDAIWVSPAADAGVGTRADPLGSLAEALALAPAGATIVLGPGVYEEPLVPAQDVVVEGVCPSQVILAGSALGPSPIAPPRSVDVGGAVALTLRGVTISADAVGVAARGDASVALESVHIDAALGAGILLDGGTVSLAASELWISGTRVSGAEDDGRGIRADGPVVLELAAVALVGNHNTGLDLWSGAHAELSDVHIEGTRAAVVARGLRVVFGATLDGDRVTLVDNESASVVVGGEDAVAVLTSAVVAETLDGPGDGNGYGAILQAGGTLVTDRVQLVDHHGAGVSVEYSTVELRRTLVTGTRVNPTSQQLGRGLQLLNGQALLEDCAISDNEEAGVWAYGSGTVLDADAVLIEGTRPNPELDQLGYGIFAHAAAQVSLTRLAALSNTGVGVRVQGPTTSIGIASSIIASTAPFASSGAAGQGLMVEAAEGHVVDTWFDANDGLGLGVLVGTTGVPATVTATGNAIRGSLEAVQADGDVSVELVRNAIVGDPDGWALVAVRGSQVHVSGNVLSGAAVLVRDGASLDFEGNALLSPWEAGILTAADALDDGTMPPANELSITRNLVSGVVANPELVSGHALLIDDGTVAELQQNVFEGARHSTVVVSDAASASSTDDLVLDPVPDGEGWAVGVVARTGGTVTLDGGAIVGATAAGVLAVDTGTSLQASGLLVEGTRGWGPGSIYGMGLNAVDADVQLLGCAFVDNTTAAVGLLRLDPGAVATVDRCWLSGTVANGSAHYGFGLLLEETVFAARHLLVEGVRGAGISALEASGSVQSTLVRETASTSIALNHRGELTTASGLADGAVVMGGSDVDITTSRFEQCGRAGVLYDQSSGSVSASVLSSNGFGLVLQGSPTPSVADDVVFDGNTQGDVVEGGDLAVPSEPLAVPVP